MNTTQTPDIVIPLGGEAHAIAKEFATLQETPQQGKQVYLNTLAVYAVYSYLQWLQIDSQHPALTPPDAADLVLPDIGKLECPPVLPGETTFRISPQARENRIGCVAVQFSENLDQVELLGFFPAVGGSTLPEQISLANLQPLDVLFDYIPDVVGEAAVTSINEIPVNLSRWLEGIFETGWQTLEILFSEPAFVRSERSLTTNTQDTIWAVRRGKRLDLGIPVAGNPFTLIVSIAPTDEQLNVLLQVYPSIGSICLPPHLQLMVLDEMGVPFPELQAEAGNEDISMQLEFTGELGEYFRIKLAFEDVSITEYFMV